MKKIILLLLLASTIAAQAAPPTYNISGRVIDRQTRQGVGYATVVIAGQSRGDASDSMGRFTIRGVQPGIHRLSASCLGYKTALSAEYVVAAATPFIEIEIEPDGALEAVTVRPSPFRVTAESPLSMTVIGVKEIEKSPGANRDISRIVRSYPGVAFSPVGYRNDLIVRGGGPSENKFYMDGIEIPNINHFATQGATGGPVSIVNADLVREISFYTGAFPADRAGASSSVLDFQLKDGNRERQTFKATLGASEVSLSGSGHFSEKATYLFSIRQSYLQVLFKMLGLPFLPNFIDGQFKIKSRITDRDELTILGLAGFDNMRLNTDEKGEDAEYLLSYLPRIQQETFTVGAVYRRYAGSHVRSITLSHNYLNNREDKYRNNDTSSDDNLTLRLRGVEQKTTLRAENKSFLGRWTLRGGAEASYSTYSNTTTRALYEQQLARSLYTTNIGIWGWGLYVGGDYASADKRLTASVGLRADGNSYSAQMAKLWRQLSPRASVSYALSEGWSVSAATGLYHQLPPYTALGFRNNDGELVNKELDYQRVFSSSAGVDWRHKDRLLISIEGFYKRYNNIPLSTADNIPLACKGADYGAVGAETLLSIAAGRAYGAEAMARWQIPGRASLVGSFTWYRSQYRNSPEASYTASAWDNRFIVNISGTVDLPRNWSVGGRLSCIGGAPYTPYDVEKSSLVEAWNAQGRPYYDYAQYNNGRLDTFTQLDIRIDKTFYFKSCMLGLYLDLQNITKSKLRQPDVLLSTGQIENPNAQPSEQRYVMKSMSQVSGTLLPSIGITVEF